MLIKAGYRQSERHRDNAGTTLTPSCANPPPPPLSATAGSAAPSNGTASPARSPSCGNATPTPKSSPTPAAGSTSGERDLSPYWSDFSAAISSALWLPTETGLPGSDSSSSRGRGSRQHGLQPRTGTHPGYSRHPSHLQLPASRPAAIPQRDQGGSGSIRPGSSAGHSGCGLMPPGGVTTKQWRG